MPRVFNVMLAAFLLACTYPLITTFPRHSGVVRAYLVVAVLPVLLVVALCLSSALRPGSLGRAARRFRRR